MNKIAWNAFIDADCDSFNVYRSITGIVVAFPNTLVATDTITFAATSVDQQNITFSAVDIDSVVAEFNAAAKGAYAVKNTAGDAVIIRTTARNKAKFKLYPCTFATNTSQTPRVVVPQLEWYLAGNVPFVPDTFEYEFEDDDGTDFDSYRLTSVVGVEESIPSLIQTPQLGTELLCAIEGRVADSANRPVVGLAIRAQIRVPMASSDVHGIDGQSVEALTDTYGRFSLYLTRCQLYLLQIQAVGYNETIQVPDQASAGFLDLVPTLAGRFTPFEDPQ